MRFDPVDYRVIVDQLSAVAREMQEVIFRTGYSTIIRESQDASCAVLTGRGEVVGQHVVLPLHLGAFPACARALLARYPAERMAPGDVFVVNHPYRGGSPHASDMAVLRPVFVAGEVVAFTANIAHKSDIGGMVPGSGSGSAREIFQEGLHLPPVRYGPEVADILAANSRTPDLVLGDLAGQAGTCVVGASRVEALYRRWGRDMLESVYEELFRRTELRLRQAVAGWPDGVRESEGWLDDDGVDLGHPVRIALRVEKRGDDITFDFTGSADQTRGPANIRPPLVEAGCAYALVAATDPALSFNEGLRRAFHCVFRPGSVLDPNPPAPVNSYISAAQMVAEVALDALGQLAGGLRLAQSGGSGALAAGWQSGSGYVQYEILGSALAARSDRDGVSSVDVHIANCRCTPVEVVESEFPVRVERFELRRDSGGAGRWRGGLGFSRTYRALGPARLTLRTDKHATPALGAGGGRAGAIGGFTLLGAGEDRRLPARFGDVHVVAGDRFRLDRPGGGGYGDPWSRPAASVLADVRDGYVSAAEARRTYGVAVTGEAAEAELDAAATERLRASPPGGGAGWEAPAPAGGGSAGG